MNSESELLQFYNQLEQSSKKGTWYFCPRNNHYYFSEVCSEILGVKYGSLLSRVEAEALIRSSDVSAVRNLIDTCLSSTKSIETNIYLKCNSQGSRCVHLIALPIVENNKVIKIVGSLQEVSKARPGEISAAELDVHAHQYQNCVDHFAIVAFTDKNGVITEVNDQFCEITQYSREELIGKTHNLINSGVHDSSFFKYIWERISSGNTWKGEICNMKKNGEHYWVETYISPLYKGEAISGYMAIRFDITDKKLLQEEVTEQRDRDTFSAQLASIGELSVSVAHEINNPLSIISGMNSVMPSFANNEDKIKNLSSKIEGAVIRIKKITDNLRRYGRKSKQSDIETLSLSTVVDNSLEFIQASLSKQNITLTLDQIPDDILIRCREIEISQTLINLINNARDAIKELDEKWIRVSIINRPESVSLFIVDSGSGIPLDVQYKMMQSFYTTKKIGEGTGLGLSLAKRFVEEHGGQLRVDNTNANTSFEIQLPKVVSYDECG